MPGVTHRIEGHFDNSVLPGKGPDIHCKGYQNQGEAFTVWICISLQITVAL